MTTALVTVTPSRVTVSGLLPDQLTDLYYNAPEPPPAWEFGGIRPVSANLLYLMDALPGAMWDDVGGLLLAARAMRYLERTRRVEPTEQDRNFPFKMPPHDYQLKVFAAARHMTNMALAPVAVGTGKTKMTLDIAAAKFLDNEIDCLAVIAPAGVHRQWINTAVPQHLSPAVRHQAMVWKPNKRALERLLPPHCRGARRLRIVAINVEALSTESGKAATYLRKFAESGRCMAVVDESSRIKSPQATRTKVLVRMRDKFAVRAILSGTPITKNVIDLFPQYQFLDPGIIGLSNYLSFRNRYCVTVSVGRGAPVGAVKVVGQKNVEELVKKVAPVTFMVPKDVLGLPEQQWLTREVPLTAEQTALYKALRDRLVEELAAKRIKAPINAAAGLVRMQQVLSGRYYEEPTEEEVELGIESGTFRPVGSYRMSVLEDVLREHDGQAVIWARFQADIDDICRVLRDNGARVAAYDGRTSDAAREEAVEAFKEGRLDYWIGNPAAGGTGVDGLQVASLAVYYSNSFNAEHRWQSEGRIHRIGTRWPVAYMDLVAPGTLDALVLSNLRSKGSLVDSIYNNPGQLLEEQS